MAIDSLSDLLCMFAATNVGCTRHRNVIICLDAAWCSRAVCCNQGARYIHLTDKLTAYVCKRTRCLLAYIPGTAELELGTHGVQVFNPDGINRPIKHQPFHGMGAVGHGFPDQLWGHTILPVIADWVVRSIQLAQADALGIQAKAGYRYMCHILSLCLM